MDGDRSEYERDRNRVKHFRHQVNAIEDGSITLELLSQWLNDEIDELTF